MSRKLHCLSLHDTEDTEGIGNVGGRGSKGRRQGGNKKEREGEKCFGV
jgi:hypothetical protein